MGEYDLLIRDALIVDGSGKPPYRGSIGVEGDRITAIGDVEGDAKIEIEAGGLVASPGFIDAHSHADWTLLWYPLCESYVMQGVTTFVGGQCGGSPAPLREYIRLPWMLMDYLDELHPYMYYPPPLFPLETVNEWMEEKFGWRIDWTTMEGYFKRVEREGISINYAPLVGHGTIRYAVMGRDYKRHSKPEELEEMKELIAEALEQGCIGMSTGLDYDPDVFADKSEIDECVAVLREYGGIYSPHWRRTGRRRDIAVGTRLPERIKGIAEVIDTCRRTGVPLHIAHLYGGYDVYPPPPPVLQEAVGKATLQLIDEARAEGLRVTFDVIPYYGWNPMPYLCSLHLTPWLRLLGSREALAKWLRVEDFRRDVKEALAAGKWFIRVHINPNTNPRWAENILIVKHKNEDYNGKTLAEVAELRGKNPLDTLFDLIAEDPDARGATRDYRISEDYVKLFFKHPASMVGVDVAVFDDKYQMRSPPYYMPGINNYGAYPSFISRYVREQRLLTLEEAVRKCTSLPAEVYGIKHRGLLREGYYADIVLFDLERLKVAGDLLEPRRYPEGIEYVIVNGEMVVEKGEHRGVRPGRILKRVG